MIMSSTCYNKRPLDDVGEDLEQREWKVSCFSVACVPP